MAKKPFKKNKDKEKVIAKTHIEELFKEADKVFDKNPDLADKYVKQARTIQMKFRLRMPSELKKRFCKHCHNFLVPGKNLRVRVNDGKVVYHCQNCKNYMRFPYTKK